MMGNLRQIIDWHIRTLIDSIFVAIYYAATARDSGLLGPGALGVWRRRALPSPRRAPSPAAAPLWLHISGPGDASAAEAFVCDLARVSPDTPVFATCTTKAAWDRASQAWAGLGIEIAWIPFDLPFPMRRLIRKLRPLAFVGMQGEIWPNLIRELNVAGIPTFLLRVDMLDWDTQQEFPGWVRPYYERVLAMVDVFSVRAPLYGDRLQRSGVDPARVFVGRDYRFETLPEADASRASHYRTTLGRSDSAPLVVLASPRLDEIKAVVSCLEKAIRRRSIRFVVAPVEEDVSRRADRWFRTRGYQVARRSHDGDRCEGRDLVLLDTRGELSHLYAAATAVVVGDSFPPVASVGANLWEALVQGAPVLYGSGLVLPGSARKLEEGGAAVRVADYPDLPEALRRMLNAPPPRARVQDIVGEIADVSRGAAGQDVELVLEYLGSHSPEAEDARCRSTS
ncbi:MAG: hypothetical protein GY851_03680 [bacterium]|nr:hypothetical protein [bacterium]